MANLTAKSNIVRNVQKEQRNELVFSYLTLRNLIGFTGMLLPVILAILPSRSSVSHGFEPSISDYFYTDRGDILVVLLCIIGVFLFTYKGYNKYERILTILAGISGIGVAFVPTENICGECLNTVHTKNGGVLWFIAETGWHFIFAATFLVSLAIMSLIFFTRTDNEAKLRKENGRRSQKAKRNSVYFICGWTMLASVGAIGAYFLYKKFTGFEFKTFPIVYFFETVAIEAFGISWLTKGETLWPDGKHYLVKKFS